MSIMLDWIGSEDWWDPLLLSACQQHVTTGHHDDAILRAFKCVEERIRELANVGASEKNSYGTRLVNRAFDRKTDFARRLLRRGVKLDSARSFVNGAFGLFRNEPAHRFIEYDRETCVAVLKTANLILRLLDKGQTTIDDLWYAVRNPEAVRAPDVAVRRLLDEGPAILHDLLSLRGRSIENGKQVVADLIDGALQDYFQTLGWSQGQRQLLDAFRESLLRMLEDEDRGVRRGVVYYLQFFPSDDVRRSLCRILSQSSELPEELTVGVIDALAVLGGSISREAVTELLIQAPSPGVKRAAIEALGDMGYARDAITALLDVLDALSWPDKQRAIETLGKLEAREALPALVNCLRDTNYSVQIEACDTLGEFAEPGAVEALGELLLSATWPDVRRAAARALAKIRTDASFSCMERCLILEMSKSESKQDKTLLKILGEALKQVLVMMEELV